MDLSYYKNKFNLSDLELVTQNNSSYKLSFVANKIKQTESTNSSGFAFRVIKDKKIGFVASYGNKDLNLETLEKTIPWCLEHLQFSPEIEFKLPSYMSKKENSHKISQIQSKDVLPRFMQSGELIIESILKEAPNVLVDVSFEVDNVNEVVKNSNNIDCQYTTQTYSLLIGVRETQEGDFIEIYSGTYNSSFPKYENYLSDILKFYRLSKKHSKVKNGSYPVLFTSKASKDLFNVIEIALNGKQINKKSSPWHDKLSKKVLSDSITLKQDPKFGYMAREFDDEGSVIKDLVLVSNGVLQNFYYDLYAASSSPNKCFSTGNGFKSALDLQPQPQLLNLIVLPGKRSIDEIIRGINYGLLVDQTIGGLTTDISGDFSVNVDVGFLIENGEMVGRVKDTMLSGNIYTSLNNVIELSNAQSCDWSNIYSPDMLLSGFTVTSK